MWKVLLALAYTNGAREDELLNLTRADVDFQKNQLHITRKERCDWIQPWQPKDCELCTIPLPELTVNLLAAWQSVAQKNGLSLSGRLFQEKHKAFYEKDLQKRARQDSNLQPSDSKSATLSN
jgi:integrase